MIDKDVNRESSSKVNNGKAARSLFLVSKRAMSAEEAEIDMITDLLNQISVERVIPADWRHINVKEML